MSLALWPVCDAADLTKSNSVVSVDVSTTERTHSLTHTHQFLLPLPLHQFHLTYYSIDHDYKVETRSPAGNFPPHTDLAWGYAAVLCWSTHCVQLPARAQRYHFRSLRLGTTHSWHSKHLTKKKETQGYAWNPQSKICNSFFFSPGCNTSTACGSNFHGW